MSREEEIKDMKKPGKGDGYSIEVHVTAENRILVVLVKGHDFEPEKLSGKKLESVKVNGIEVVNT